MLTLSSLESLLRNMRRVSGINDDTRVVFIVAPDFELKLQFDKLTSGRSDEDDRIDDNEELVFELKQIIH
jgi:hypothetical protein